MAKSPYIKGIGQLVLDRYTAQDHFEGKQFRHKASYIDLDTTLIIDGYTANTVWDAILDLNGVINSGALTGYNRIQLNGVNLTKRPTLNFKDANSIVDNGSNATDITVFPGDSTKLLDGTGQQVVVGSNLNLSAGTLSASGGGGGISQLTTDVLASGSGIVAATVAQLTGIAGVLNVLATTTRLASPGAITYYDGVDINLLKIENPSPSNYLATVGDISSPLINIGKSIDFQVGNSLPITAANIDTDVNSLVSVNLQAGLKLHTTLVTGNYTVDSVGNDLQLNVNLSSAPAIIALPTCTPGRAIIITDAGNNFDQYPVTLMPFGGATIRNLPSLLISKKGYLGYIIGDASGTNWIVSHGETPTYFTQSFTVADITGPNLIVAHNLGELFVNATVYDENYYSIIPDNIHLINTSTCSIDLTSFLSALSSSPSPWNVLIST
jgi:hypothetical protein